MSTPVEEERKARERQRQLDRLQRSKSDANAKAERSRRAEIIRDELSKPRARRCRCGITSRTTHEQLRALGEGCTGGSRYQPGYICPVLDAIRRRLGR